jgi:hypothetical protein
MTQTQNTLQRIEEILPQLPLQELEMVLTFTEFVHERAAMVAEDDVLWSFIEREKAYRTKHPEDILECDSDDELLAALDTPA